MELDPWPRFVALSFLTVFLFYVIGHTIALLAYALIDKLLVERTFGHPFHRLFNNIFHREEPSLWYARRSRLFYKSLVATIAASIILGVNGLYRTSLVCVVLFFIVVLSKLLFTCLSLTDIHNPYSLRKEDDKWRCCAENLWKISKFPLIPLYLAFDSPVAIVLSFLFRMHKPFVSKFQKEFSREFKDAFGISVIEAGTNTYWLTFAYLNQSDPDSSKLIQHWLNIYIFARNLTMAFFALFAYGIVVSRLNEPTSRLHYLWTLSTLVLCLLFFLRYYSLYYNDYSKYVFRAFYSYRCQLNQKRAINDSLQEPVCRQNRTP